MLADRNNRWARGTVPAGLVVMILAGCTGMPSSTTDENRTAAPYVVKNTATGHTITTAPVVDATLAPDSDEGETAEHSPQDEYGALTCYEWAKVPELTPVADYSPEEGGMQETLVVLRHAKVEKVEMPARYEWVDGPAVIRPACRRGEESVCPGSEAGVPAEVRLVRQKVMVQPERTERVVVPAVVKHALLERLPAQQTPFCGSSCSGFSLWESDELGQPPRQDLGYYYERRLVPCEKYH